VVQDIIAANLSVRQGPTFLGRLYYFAFGLIDRIGCLAYMPMMWSDLPRFRQGIRRVLDSGYTNVVGAHWGHGLPTPKQTREFTERLRWLTELGGMAHKGLVLRYFASQPTFMRDLVRYKFASRRVARS